VGLRKESAIHGEFVLRYGAVYQAMLSGCNDSEPLIRTEIAVIQLIDNMANLSFKIKLTPIAQSLPSQRKHPKISSRRRPIHCRASFTPLLSPTCIPAQNSLSVQYSCRKDGHTHR